MTECARKFIEQNRKHKGLREQEPKMKHPDRGMGAVSGNPIHGVRLIKEDGRPVKKLSK